MPNDPESTIAVTARKEEYWKPWFGDRSHFERLARLCETLFEDPRSQLVELAAGLPDGDYNKNAAESNAKNLRVEMVTHDGVRTVTGTISALFPSVDFPHTKEIKIKAEIPAYPALGLKASLLVHCKASLGMRIEVESNDEAWVAQAHARLTEEAGRRRPWWANMKNHHFTGIMTGIAGLAAVAFFVLVQFAIDFRVFSATWWFVAVIANVSVFATQQAISRMPVFEVHAEGSKSRRETFLFWLLVTTPTVFTFGILINLLTDD